MDADDTDIIRTAKPGKKSLLERYDVPVEHLSYEYISECKNGKKLERIVTILRSGEEGFYPDLTKHAEERLAVVKPTSIILRKSEPVIRRNMLGPSECKEIDKDINDWTHEMLSREKDLEEGKAVSMLEPLPQPDIRQFKEEPVKRNTRKDSKNSDTTKRIASCDYAAWDKYDVDTELNKMDIRDEQKQAEAKRLQQKQKEMTKKKKKLDKHTLINKSSLTGTEINVMAEQEREKGNEAFRAGDYEEALDHYSTSIRIDSNIIAYNNRAMTYIKLHRYEDAFNDCNLVLSMEYANIKALLRRAVSLENLQKPTQALADYEAALKLEPTNSVAIAGVKKLRKPCESRKIRMAIEEQKESTTKDSKFNGVERNTYCNAAFQSKLNIESSICYCDRAPGPSQNLRPRPHFKADYCLENENRQKVTIKNDVVKKFESPKNSTYTSPNVNSSSASNSIQERNSSSFTKPKSIFSCAMPAKQNSSVVIEELPSEASNNNYADIKSKEETVNKNNSSAKITHKNKNDASKIAKESNVKNSNKYHEDNYNTLSPRKIQVADKYENKTSKSEKHISKNFKNIDNGYEFMRIWQSLKNDTDLMMHAQLLRSLNVDKLGAVLGSELDGNMFSTILRCLEQHFCTPNDTELVNNFLKSFSQVKRFSIVNMFMNTEDKRGTLLPQTSYEKHTELLRRAWDARGFVAAANLLYLRIL